MTTSDKLREIAKAIIERAWETGNSDAHDCKTRFNNDRDKHNCVDNYLDDAVSDLTALLEQHKEMMLREELIKYDKYIGSRGWIDNYEDWAAITSVDEYLKSREK